ncbi:hypothetical protein [Rhizobium laguerreae]|uniref:hypothetical protein n=1 Tax=Rhizobium laguerreae TaxID=1076926 RepID=UPI001C9269A9|nr:hypothetical protein [Rhizobium laguerreae]MBY3124528.1 hypothetical protein [Rhizobium laguerreae]
MTIWKGAGTRGDSDLLEGDWGRDASQTQGNGPPLEGWGIDGLKVILTTLEHQDVDGGPQLYSHIEDALLGDYDLRADLTATDIVNLRFHVSGQIYYYWNRFDYYDGEALPNQCRENPGEEDADVNLEGLTAIEIERTGDKVEAAFPRSRKRMDELGLGSSFERWLILGTKGWKHMTSVVSSMFSE